MKSVAIERFQPDFGKIYEFEVPASKSILNRALLLAAFCEGDTLIECGSFAEDTRAVLAALASLGIACEVNAGGILVHGCGKNVPNRKAEIDVGSAGTCARFLPAMLAAIGGSYLFRASEQMTKRPMEFLSELEKAGVKIEYLERKNSFPFRMQSNGFGRKEFIINTDNSTQYASALLLAGAVCPLSLRLTGGRTQGSYINITLSLLSAFGAEWKRENDTITILSPAHAPHAYEAEADISAACYFYALSLLFGIKVLVRRVKKNALQGDIRFFKLLEARGVKFTETEAGLLADGSGVTSFAGFNENLRDYSDQTLTVAALAPFASSPSYLTGIGHIRLQECDRVEAIRKNLVGLGVPCTIGDDFIEIQPAQPTRGVIETFGDHRVAMAFALTSLKTGNIAIDNSECTKKTFDGYFEELKKLQK